MPPGALHISLSTISVALSERLTDEHARRRQAFVAAPGVWPAQRGRGRQAVDCGRRADDAVAKARPLLEPLSRGISVIGNEPRQAHALKLGGNFLISAMIHSLGRGVCLRGVAGHRAGNLLRNRQQRAFPVAVLRGLWQSHAASARANTGATIDAGREGSAPAARSGGKPAERRLSLADDPGRSLCRRPTGKASATKIGPSASTAWRKSADAAGGLMRQAEAACAVNAHHCGTYASLASVG